MKKTLSFMVMALALLLTQCRKPEVKFPSPVAPEGTTVSMTVTAGPGGKTDITDAGAITWNSGDKLYVGYNGEYVGYLTLTSGQNTPTGWFSGNVTLPTGTENGEKTFHFFYLGSTERTLEVGATEATVSFATQEIYDNSGNLENASKHHVGYGSAKGTVAGSEVTGINVTLVSKVALARFSFKKGSADYKGALTLSGDNIYNSMKVNFGGTFTGEKTDGGKINLTNTTSSEKYVMLVPVGTESETLSFACDGFMGSTTLGSGIEANKFYGKSDAIAVSLHEYVDLGLSVKWAKCNLGAEHPYDYGDYYAWGEILPYYADGHSQDNPCSTWRSMTTGAGNTVIKKGYAWETYSQGGSSNFAEWTTMPYGSDKILTSARDVATQNWGSGWRMPTEADFTELINNTDMSWTTENGVAGWKCVSRKADYTDKYIFLPAAGFRSQGGSLWSVGEGSRYWSSKRSTSSSSAHCAQQLRFYDDESPNIRGYERSFGCQVRPVFKSQN